MTLCRNYLTTLYLLLSLLGQGLCAQPFYFQHYQVEDGLANNTVFSIFQDSRGFLWMGTKEGLNRFDGVTFKDFDMTFAKEFDNKEFVYSIQEGFRQTLWLGTRKGLCEFDPRSERFVLLTGTANSEVLTIVSDRKGKIWYIADSRLYCYDERTFENHSYELSGEPIATVTIDPHGVVWTASVDGELFQYRAKQDTWEPVPGVSGVRPERVSSLLVRSDGEVLMGTTGGLILHKPQTGRRIPIFGTEKDGASVYVRDILEVSADTYWVASESGIYSVNLSTGHHLILRQKDSDPYSLSDNALYALYKDREGGIWCGSYFGGVNYYHQQHTYFNKYFRRHDTRSLSGQAVRELCPDDLGYLWIGTEDAGLNRMDLTTGEIVPKRSSPGGGSSTNVHALLVDGTDLWVGTFQHGLDVLHVKTGRPKKHFSADPEVNGLRSNFILSSLRTCTGTLLFGTSQGVHVYRRDQGRFDLFEGFPAGIYVFCLYEDAMGVLWAGTIGHGLYYYDPLTGARGNFNAYTDRGEGLSSNSVCGLFEDSRSRLWISTEGGGLCRLDHERKIFTRFNTTNGLPSNMVYSVLEDDTRALWVSTSRGLARLDSESLQWETYTKAHGLLTDQFSYSSSYKAPDGTLYFGSVKGLISFNPSQLAGQKVAPPVHITGFQVHNQDLPIGSAAMPTSVSFADTIHLRYDQSTFSISFAALSFTSAAMTSYLYQMEGVDKDWNYLPSNRMIYFTGLTPGDYRFRVRTVLGGADSERTLAVFIAPPWWLTTSAYFLYFLLITSGIFILTVSYHERQKNRHKRKLTLFEQAKERELYKAKIEFFTQVAHEIRTPLTLIKGPLEIVIDEAEDQRPLLKNLKSIERNTERLVHLTNQLLDFRRMEREAITLSFVKTNVSLLLKEICRPFRELAETGNVNMTIHLPTPDVVAFVDREALHKILDNLIGNAFKYAKSVLTVHIWSTKDKGQDLFCIEISNDGPIIPKGMRRKIFEPFFRLEPSEMSGSGIGLPLALSLTELHHGTLVLADGEQDRNTFRLTLPLIQSVAFNFESLSLKNG